MEQYRWNARVSAKQDTSVRAYVGREQFDVSCALNFDVTRSGISALEYALAALAADVVSGVQQLAKKRRIQLDGVEASVQGVLENPLVCLGVVGEEGSPKLKQIQLKVFVSTPVASEPVNELWEEVLKRSPLASTFADLVELELVMKRA